MCFLASKKKIEFLRQIENGKEESELPPVKLLIRDRVSITLIIDLMKTKPKAIKQAYTQQWTVIGCRCLQPYTNTSACYQCSYIYMILSREKVILDFFKLFSLHYNTWSLPTAIHLYNHNCTMINTLPYNLDKYCKRLKSFSPNFSLDLFLKTTNTILL